MLQFVPKFSYSIKKQIRNPKKVYDVDTGLYTHNTIKLTGDMGRRLENLVYLHLCRMSKEIYYFSEDRE